MARILSAVLSLLLIILLISVVTGYLVDSNFKKEVTIDLNYTKEDVFRILTEIDLIPRNRKGVESVEIVARLGDLVAWKENLNFDGFRKYRMTRRIENEYLKIEMTESSYGMTGSWEFIIRDNPESRGSVKLTIKEDSNLDSLIRRGYRFYIGRDFELVSLQRGIRVGLFENFITKP